MFATQTAAGLTKLDATNISEVSLLTLLSLINRGEVR